MALTFIVLVNFNCSQFRFLLGSEENLVIQFVEIHCSYMTEDMRCVSCNVDSEAHPSACLSLCVQFGSLLSCSERVFLFLNWYKGAVWDM